MKLVSTLLLTLLTLNSYANDKIKITDLVINEKNAHQNQLVIELGEMIKGNPEILIKDKILQVSVPDSFVWPKIDKTIGGNSVQDETKISAYQFDPSTVRVRALLPYSLDSIQDRVSMTLTKNKIIVDFPKVNVPKTAAPIVKKEVKAVVAPTPKKENVEQYDESYLEKLLKDKEERLVVAEPTVDKKEEKINDSVKTAQSSTVAAKGQDSFSVSTYIGKFVAFLGVVLLIFYGLVGLMKKGVFKKTRLGFLHSTKMIEVLNTTYVAPKKSVMLIRAHNQVFLVGSTDKGFHSLGEIKDVADLLKTGEKEVAGDNFDSSLSGENEQDKSFKLKDLDKLDLSEVEVEKPKTTKTQEVKDSVRLSDQIKKKVKNLKQLQ